jgi:hypothetical protein
MMFYSRNQKRITELATTSGAVFTFPDYGLSYDPKLSLKDVRRDSLDTIQKLTKGSRKRKQRIFPGDLLPGGRRIKGNSRIQIELSKPTQVDSVILELLSSYCARVYNKTVDGAPSTIPLGLGNRGEASTSYLRKPDENGNFTPYFSGNAEVDKANIMSAALANDVTVVYNRAGQNALRNPVTLATPDGATAAVSGTYMQSLVSLWGVVTANAFAAAQAAKAAAEATGKTAEDAANAAGEAFENVKQTVKDFAGKTYDTAKETYDAYKKFESENPPQKLVNDYFNAAAEFYNNNLSEEALDKLTGLNAAEIRETINKKLFDIAQSIFGLPNIATHELTVNEDDEKKGIYAEEKVELSHSGTPSVNDIGNGTTIFDTLGVERAYETTGGDVVAVERPPPSTDALEMYREQCLALFKTNGGLNSVPDDQNATYAVCTAFSEMINSPANANQFLASLKRIDGRIGALAQDNVDRNEPFGKEVVDFIIENRTDVLNADQQALLKGLATQNITPEPVPLVTTNNTNSSNKIYNDFAKGVMVNSCLLQNVISDGFMGPGPYRYSVNQYLKDVTDPEFFDSGKAIDKIRTIDPRLADRMERSKNNPAYWDSDPFLKGFKTHQALGDPYQQLQCGVLHKFATSPSPGRDVAKTAAFTALGGIGALMAMNLAVNNLNAFLLYPILKSIGDVGALVNNNRGNLGVGALGVGAVTLSTAIGENIVDGFENWYKACMKNYYAWQSLDANILTQTMKETLMKSGYAEHVKMIDDCTVNGKIPKSCLMGMSIPYYNANLNKKGMQNMFDFLMNTMVGNLYYPKVHAPIKITESSTEKEAIFMLRAEPSSMGGLNYDLSNVKSLSIAQKIGEDFIPLGNFKADKSGVSVIKISGDEVARLSKKENLFVVLPTDGNIYASPQAEAFDTVLFNGGCRDTYESMSMCLASIDDNFEYGLKNAKQGDDFFRTKQAGYLASVEVLQGKRGHETYISPGVEAQARKIASSSIINDKWYEWRSGTWGLTGSYVVDVNEADPNLVHLSHPSRPVGTRILVSNGIVQQEIDRKLTTLPNIFLPPKESAQYEARYRQIQATYNLKNNDARKLVIQDDFTKIVTHSDENGNILFTRTQ